MSYDLYVGDKLFSSWSLRGWLMFEKFGIAYREHMIGLYTGTMAADMAPLAPARLVPVMRMPDGTVVGDTMAMAETLAERHPDAGMWPTDAGARAMARWLVAEMHSGYGALRDACPMQLRSQFVGFAVPDAVRADLDRIELMWAHARKQHGGDRPWLFGAYSLADVFFAPVAARIAGYGLPVGAEASTYVAAHLADPAFKDWREKALTVSYDPFPYHPELETRDWPTA